MTWEIDIWTISLQNWRKSQFSRKFKHWLWRVQSTKFDFEGAKRSVMNGAPTLSNSFYQNNRLYRNSGTLKISILQRHEVLWIHNIDTICKQTRPFLLQNHPTSKMTFIQKIFHSAQTRMSNWFYAIDLIQEILHCKKRDKAVKKFA